MGNVNMEARQIHVRDNNKKTWKTVADALKGLEASGESVAEDITELYTRDASRASKDDIAGEFSAEQAYYAGDYVYYEGSLFKFTENHSGEWDPADVIVAHIGQNISTLESGLINLVSLDTNEKLVGKYGQTNLYRKVYDVGALPNNSSITVQIDFVNQPIIITGYAEQNGYTMPLPYISTSGGIVNIRTQNYGRELIIASTMDASAYHGHVIMYYTKQ